VGTDVDERMLATARRSPRSAVGEQVASHRRLVKPGGWVVLEERDFGSWHFNPPAPAAEQLIGFLTETE
jgi:hypothetical protein